MSQPTLWLHVQLDQVCMFVTKKPKQYHYIELDSKGFSLMLGN